MDELNITMVYVLNLLAIRIGCCEQLANSFVMQ